MKCFVTGATGFIGKHLCKALTSCGYEVVALVRPGSDLKGLMGQPNLSFVYGSLEDLSWTKRLKTSFDILFHLAVNWNSLEPAKDKALFDEFTKNGIGRLIYFSSICAAGLNLSPQPLTEDNEPKFLDRDFYGKYKWLVEQHIHRHAKENAYDAKIVRPTIVYGPGDLTNVYPLFSAIRQGNLALWNRGLNRIRFCYIGNLIDSVLRMAQSNRKGIHTYHVGDNECPTLAQMCEQISSSIGILLACRNHSKLMGRPFGFMRFVANRFRLNNSFATHFNFDKWHRSIEADTTRLHIDFPDLKLTPVINALDITTKFYFAEGLL